MTHPLDVRPDRTVRFGPRPYHQAHRVTAPSNRTLAVELVLLIVVLLVVVILAPLTFGTP